MITIEEANALKKRITQLERSAASDEGALKEITRRLKDEFDCKDLEAAKKKLEQLKKQEEKQEKIAEKAMKEFDEKWKERFVKWTNPPTV